MAVYKSIIITPFISPGYQLKCYSCLVGIPNISNLPIGQNISDIIGINPMPSSLCGDYNAALMVDCPQQNAACLNMFVDFGESCSAKN